MPLNPIVKAFLDQVSAQPGPKTWEMDAPAARESFAALMQLAGPQNVPIGAVDDLSIPAPHGAISARHYRPADTEDVELPALVFFHGGGWVIGNIETHDGLCRMIANDSGCRVISVEYRLSPEARFPAAIEDAVSALNWIVGESKSLKIDADRIAVGGDSAGGCVAAVLTQEVKRNGGPKIAFQMLLFPVTQIGEETASLVAHAEGFFLERKTLDWFYAHYLGDSADKADPRLSPLKVKDLSSLPPAFVMVAGYDPLHDEGVAYAQKLERAGVTVQLSDYPDMVHDFIYLQAFLPEAATALKEASASLKTALKPC